MSGQWRKASLGEVVELQRGYDLTEPDRRAGDVPVIGSAGPNGFHDTWRCEGPGVTVGRSGASVGVVTYVPGRFWPHNTTLYVKDFKGNDPRFIAYLLRSMPLAEMNSGAAQPSLNRNFLYPLPTRIPDLHEQRRIASILGAYDDLIQVNRRRIAVLEEMARRLFEEWFVHFRFPGHDALVDRQGQLPRGWSIAQLGDLIVLAYGKALKATDRSPGSVPVIGSSGVVGFHDEALVQRPGIVLGRKGNVGTVIWSPVPFFPIDTVFYIESAYPASFLLHQLRRMPFQSSDAAVPGLNRSAALKLPVAVPPADLVSQFDAKVAPSMRLVECLQESQQRLAASRDLLLPRLISGDLPVTTAERELEAMA